MIRKYSIKLEKELSARKKNHQIEHKKPEIH